MLARHIRLVRKILTDILNLQGGRIHEVESMADPLLHVKSPVFE